MQIVAFDYGEKKIGVAVGQTETNTSSPLQIIFNNNDQVNWNEICVLLDEWKPDLIVVGDPYNMDGSRSKIQDMSDRFSDALYKRYQIQLEKTDERLSSREANERLQNLDIGTKSSSNKHSISAQVILEDWFRSKE